MNNGNQCSKFRVELMHAPGAKLLKKPCTNKHVHILLYLYLKFEEMVHLPAAKIGTPGAGCTLNFEHC